MLVVARRFDEVHDVCDHAAEERPDKYSIPELMLITALVVATNPNPRTERSGVSGYSP
jgi:hypothetical protein